MIVRVLRFVFGCRHRHTYRERRKLFGVPVMHFVCDDCGRATPAVKRSAKEHRAAVKVGDRPTARLVRKPNVERMDRRARA